MAYKKHCSLPKAEKRELVEDELKGKMVMANYGRNNCYIIDGLIFDSTAETYTFDTQQGSISLEEYYWKTYNLNIQAKKQPLVKVLVEERNSREKKQVVLIPELLLMSGIPDDFDERKRK